MVFVYGGHKNVSAGPALACSLVFALIWSGVWWYRRNRWVISYDNGLICSHKSKPPIEVIPWCEMQEVWFQIVRRGYAADDTDLKSYYFTISHHGGKRLAFEEFFAKRRSLRKAVETEVANCLWPAVLQAYQRGKPISFGSLVVAQRGLHRSSIPPSERGRGTTDFIEGPLTSMSWSEVVSIGITKTSVVIEKQGQSEPWLARDVPNSRLLRMLIEHATGKQPATRTQRKRVRRKIQADSVRRVVAVLLTGAGAAMAALAPFTHDAPMRATIAAAALAAGMIAYFSLPRSGEADLPRSKGPEILEDKRPHLWMFLFPLVGLDLGLVIVLVSLLCNRDRRVRVNAAISFALYFSLSASVVWFAVANNLSDRYPGNSSYIALLCVAASLIFAHVILIIYCISALAERRQPMIPGYTRAAFWVVYGKASARAYVLATIIGAAGLALVKAYFPQGGWTAFFATDPIGVTGMITGLIAVAALIITKARR
jgi:hypothetical protein